MKNRMVIMILFLCSTLVIGATATFNNAYDGRLLFTCPTHHQSITKFHSIHDTHYHDRQFELGCSSIKNSSFGQSNESCSWTSQYVNNWDETFVFQCAMSGYIAGIDSYHGNSVEDRRFKFYCCQTYGLHPADCYYTGPQNNYLQPVTYTVRNDLVLRGISSTHENKYEDRIWDFEVCKLFENPYETEILG